MKWLPPRSSDSKLLRDYWCSGRKPEQNCSIDMLSLLFCFYRLLVWLTHLRLSIVAITLISNVRSRHGTAKLDADMAVMASAQDTQQRSRAER